MALNILLHEDLTMKGGAQIWLANCGQRLKDAGHNITFLLPEGSEIIADCEAFAPVKQYSHEKSAADPESVRAQFTDLLKNSQVCVTLVRQVRGKFQNVRFVGDCIQKAGLKTFLVAKTGTPDPSYAAEFYGGPLLKTSPPQCCTITIAEYTRQFIMDNFGIDGGFIQTIYNGTDTQKFKRTPEMAVEAKKRYPVPKGSFVVGSIGRFVAVKGQKVLLMAAKKLIESGKLPNVHILMVGEGDQKDMITEFVAKNNLQKNVSIHEFTKEPFYVFEACNVIAMPSFLEGLPNVLLEALAMETPCVASRIMGCPEVVVDGKTGFCFEAGDLKDESTWDKMADGCADAIFKIASLNDAGRAAMADAGKKMVFAEHDKVKCFQKILDVIQSKGAPADKPIGESDYKKMGMGEANLYAMYTGFQFVFAIPGIVGACAALFHLKSDAPVAKVSNIVALKAGPLYLAWTFMKFMQTMINANLGTARRPTGVNVPDQHVYKVNTPDGATVLMDDKSELFGPFNRAQRALQNFNEGLPFVIGEFFLAGYVFPLATSLCTAGFAAARFKGAQDYTEERTKRMSGQMIGNFFAAGLAGMVMVVGARSTYLQLK